MRMRQCVLILAVAALGLACGSGPAKEPAPVKIGMLSSMFRDVKPAMFGALSKPFYSLVQTQTGLTSELLLVPSPDELRQKMDAGEIQFGVFHGFEFAWMQQKSPDLRPLMLAAPVHRPLKAFLVVHATSATMSVGDLKGKTLALAAGTREHSRLFVERACLKDGLPMLEFFGKVTNPANAEEALHDVADDKAVQAAVVDGAGLEAFRGRNPGRFKRLKVLAASESFPESVVAVRHGAVADDVVRRFRDGMANAHTTPLGRQMMSLWSLTGFEAVPGDYPQRLTDVMKRYPASVIPIAATSR
jgi:ABC-type phosphate/phosphonate transport system substrate-binding protein